MDTLSFEELHLVREAYCGAIRGHYGIELTWVEKSALGFYIHLMPAVHIMPHFLNDYFGLDTVLLGRQVRDGYRVGLGLAGTDEFKAYCRRRVSVWRDERELM